MRGKQQKDSTDFWLGIACIAFLLFTMIGVALGAEYIPIGQNVTVQTVVCDTKEQAESIPATHKSVGYQEARAKYAELRSQLNEDGEPKCLMGTYEMVIVKRVGIFTNLVFPQGIKTLYILEVTIGEYTFFALSDRDAGVNA